MKMARRPSYQMADDPTLTLADAVATALTGNPHIPSPQPAMTVLQPGIDVYRLSLSKARTGSNEAKAKKNADKKALISLLRDESDYVNLVAKGDEVILASSGFPLTKDRQPRVLGVPDAKVKLGKNTGEILLYTKAVKGAIGYKHQYTSDPALGTWSEIVSSTAKQTIEGLTPGTTYTMRIIAVGTKGQTTVSETVVKMAN